MKDILLFYNNLKLPDAHEFVKAYLELKCEPVKTRSHCLVGYFDDKYRQEIIEHFKLNDEITQTNVMNFIYELAEYIDTQENGHSHKYKSSIDTYLWSFVQLVENLLQENYIFLKYGKKYSWEYQKQTYNIDNFLNQLGLKEYFKKLIRKMEIIENAKQFIKYTLIFTLMLTITYILNLY